MMAEFRTQEIADHFGVSPKVVTKLIGQEHLRGRKEPDGAIPIGYRWMVVAESMDAIGEVIKARCSRLARRMNGETPTRKPANLPALSRMAKVAHLLNRKDDLFSIDDVAKALGKNPTTLYGFLTREKLTTTKVGGRAYLPREAVLKLAEYYRPVVETPAPPPLPSAETIHVANVAALAMQLSRTEDRILETLATIRAEVETLTNVTVSLQQRLKGLLD